MGVTRIIGGTHGGQRIATPNTDRTRPTADRVREAFFAALISWAGTVGEELPLAGLSFLDLFAGSGAIGLEAASRGASPVTLVEHDRSTAALIRKNAATLSIPADVVTGSVSSFLDGPARRHDVVWLDPPYALPTAEVNALVASLVERGWLAPDGLVVVERSSRDEPITFGEGFVDRWERRYGETTLFHAQIGD